MIKEGMNHGTQRGGQVSQAAPAPEGRLEAKGKGEAMTKGKGRDATGRGPASPGEKATPPREVGNGLAAA